MAVSVGSHLTRKKQHFPYEIAVLCYDSPQSVLSILHAYRIPPQRITLFVQTKQDEHAIQEHISRHRYGHLIVGGQGRCAMETLLHHHYPPGTLLVVLEDSCLGLRELTQPQKVVKSLIGLIRSGFDACRAATAGLWGVYPINEEAFLRPTISSTLNYTSPLLWGCIVMPVVFTTECYTHHERILAYYSVYSKCIRFNSIAIHHHSRPKTNEHEAKELYTRYPSWISLHRESSGVYLRLHDSDRESKKL